MTSEELEAEFGKSWVKDNTGTCGGEGWHGIVYGHMPVQGNGEVDGHPWYFRSRWSHWCFNVAPPGVEPSSVGGGPYDVPGWFIESSVFRPWNMEHEEAYELIKIAIVAFRASQIARAKAES